jgi:hypothetical protein
MLAKPVLFVLITRLVEYGSSSVKESTGYSQHLKCPKS